MQAVKLTSEARLNMVDNQLRPNKVARGPVLQRFMDVPRESFADVGSAAQAYVDNLLPMGQGRVMFAPLTLARMLQELNLTAEDNVLIVAGGTGYTAAIAAPLVKKVTLVEENNYLLDVARSATIDLHLNNIEFVKSSPEEGFAKNAPYNVIIIDAAVEEVPQALIEQLAENGRIGAVVGKGKDLKQATVYVKVGKTLFEESLFETKGAILENFKQKETFVF